MDISLTRSLTMKYRRVSVAEGKQSLPRLLREVEEADTTIMIHRRDELAGVLVGPDTYERLMRLRSYVDALRLSEELAGLPLNAVDLARDARLETESRA
jgi:PHD/YefM family antitoxin component YafN of YafNO toxin-antitoxin module